MKVLVVGGGGREHAIVRALHKSDKISALYCAPGNAGIKEYATLVPIKATDIHALHDFAKENNMDYVVVAPDDPLCMGLVDLLKESNIPAFGPSKSAARIEGSKVFSKNLMQKYNIATAQFQTFSDIEKALQFVQTLSFPVVIKADGLALGKGVVIAQNLQEAQDALHQMMEENKFGNSGKTVVIEEFLEGKEVTVLCFTDGKNIVPMLSSMDHKRIFDHDQGLNTGGMGVIAPSPYYTKEIEKACMDTIFLPTIHAMQQENCPFTGCLYFGLILTKEGPKVIEYNCRFGDPEAEALLPLLQTDLFEIMLSTNNQTLDKMQILYENKHSCCVVLASKGYPEAYQTGKQIFGIKDAEKNAFVCHAGTKYNDEQALVTAGGRVLNVTCLGNTLQDAIQKAYQNVALISFENCYYRKDIGQSALQK